MCEEVLALLCTHIKTLHATEHVQDWKRILFRVLRGIGKLVRDVDLFNTLVLSHGAVKETDTNIVATVYKLWDKVHELKKNTPPALLEALAIERRYFDIYVQEKSGVMLATEMSTCEAQKRNIFLGDTFQQLKTVPLPAKTKCVICHEHAREGSVLSCGHMYHADCIRRWGVESDKCPTCMQPHVDNKRQKVKK